MIELAISILWLLLGAIILLCVVWLAIYVIKMYVPIPPKVELTIWIVILILCLIGALTLLAGHSSFAHGPSINLNHQVR